MKPSNIEIAALFEEMADLLEIDGANPFRVRAYRNAARTLMSMGREAYEIVEAGESLSNLPGIGKDLAGKIEEIIKTGSFADLEQMRQKIPAGLRELLQIPGLGPKKIGLLYKELGITNSTQLLEACKKGQVRKLPGFGPKTEAKILKALQAKLSEKRRFLLAEVEPYAQALKDYLFKQEGVKQVVIAGSYRRRKETVGDLDILVTASAGSNPIEFFVNFRAIKEILAKGTTKASIVLHNNLQVDMRVIAKESFGACLHYFTGSKAHNIAIRKLAQKKGFKINEYGVFKGKERVAGESEESVFEILGLSYIPPELREDRGEIEAALSNSLPNLIKLEDLKGDLHLHTIYSDGISSIKEMAEEAKAMGLQYIAISDHSKRLRIANGLDASRLLQQIEEIDEVNSTITDFTVLKSIEVDILEDGSLDLPDDVLEKLDLVVGAVHSRFNLPKEQQTARILKAMDNPNLSILAHPTGRILLKREPYNVDVEAMIEKAKETGVALELNANPNRLDLNDIYCRQAKEAGVKIAINSDAHSPNEIFNLLWGIGQARRGWLEPDDVINTLPVKKLLALFKR